jgi:hypothetical protein
LLPQSKGLNFIRKIEIMKQKSKDTKLIEKIITKHTKRKILLKNIKFLWNNCTIGHWGWLKLQIIHCGTKSLWRVLVVNYNYE